jgi:hypothetical protein
LKTMVGCWPLRRAGSRRQRSWNAVAMEAMVTCAASGPPSLQPLHQDGDRGGLAALVGDGLLAEHAVPCSGKGRDQLQRRAPLPSVVTAARFFRRGRRNRAYPARSRELSFRRFRAPSDQYALMVRLRPSILLQGMAAIERCQSGSERLKLPFKSHVGTTGEAPAF